MQKLCQNEILEYCGFSTDHFDKIVEYGKYCHYQRITLNLKDL